MLDGADLCVHHKCHALLARRFRQAGGEFVNIPGEIAVCVIPANDRCV